jgi:hypothetical protein
VCVWVSFGDLSLIAPTLHQPTQDKPTSVRVPTIFCNPLQTPLFSSCHILLNCPFLAYDT